jgi:hypothetical protein
VIPNEGPGPGPIQLALPVDSDACGPGRHSFVLRGDAATSRPICRTCSGSELNWERLWRRDPADQDYLFQALKQEAVRLDWWTRDVDQAAMRHALRKGASGIEAAAERRLWVSVGHVIREGRGAGRPYRDGYQTPYGGNIIYYAQHAVACCCRRCMRCWHGVPYGRDLTARELGYFTRMIVTYIAARVPSLATTGDVLVR